MSSRSRTKEHRQRTAEARLVRGGAAEGGDPRPDRSVASWHWLGLALLAAATLLAYERVRHAGFIWDDDAHLINPGLSSLHGLRRIWTEPGATQQYYPVLYTAFWLEQRLWGYSATGYHLANVALHLVVVLALYRVLRRLAVPGALLAASAFALHPVCVESVAWISEQKNTLSAVLYLAAGLAYLRFDGERRARWYVLGISLFALALLSKSVTATLPAALLVVFWWKRGRLSWRRDLRPLLPWFAIASAAGAITAWVEQTLVGADGGVFPLGMVGRFLVAGRAVCFYFRKDLWPADLVFIYPHWSIDVRDPIQYAFPAAVAAVTAALFLLRRRTRGPLAAALLFIGTLFPALGFIDAYPFRYSYVADHFQYLAAAMLLAAGAAGLSVATRPQAPGVRVAAGAAAAGVLALLAALTWRQTAMYSDVGTLWQVTLERNPACWMAYNNLGLALMADGQPEEAMAQYRKALEIEPGYPGAHNNLGIALLGEGRVDEAVAQLEAAIAIAPRDAESHNNLGLAFRRQGKLAEALGQYGAALEIKPDDLLTNFNMGNACLQAGRVDDAIARYQKALQISPGFADAHNNLGNAYRSRGRMGGAVAEYRRALAIDPANARARTNLADTLRAGGR
jgi:tetratricopeptide (TPR) repeat protein